MNLLLDRHGWLRPSRDATLAPSPNFDARPDGMPVILLVIHNISLPPGEFGGPYVQQLFQNRIRYEDDPWFEQNLRGLRVAAHFFIRRDGEVMQFVSCDARAWHAGASSFEGRERCNDFSIGIEMEGTDTLPYADEQYDALRALVPQLRARYPLRAVRGHEHIAPGRKTDPGPYFDWARFGWECGLAPRMLPPAD
jgi:AmpD protein